MRPKNFLFIFAFVSSLVAASPVRIATARPQPIQRVAPMPPAQFQGAYAPAKTRSNQNGFGVRRPFTSNPQPAKIPTSSVVSSATTTNNTINRLVTINNTTNVNNRGGGCCRLWWGGGVYFGKYYFPGWYYAPAVYPGYWYSNGLINYSFGFAPFGGVTISGVKFDLDAIHGKDHAEVEGGAVVIGGAQYGNVRNFSGTFHKALPLAPGDHDITIVLHDGRELPMRIAVQEYRITHVQVRFDQAPTDQSAQQ